MKKLMLSVLGAVALSLTACGTATPEESSSQPTPALGTELRLRGENLGDYGAALVQVRRISITTPEGLPVPVQLTARHAVDLALSSHSHLLGRFEVPQGVQSLWVEVEFDDFGGYEDAQGGGVIDTRVAPLRFEAPVEYVSERDRVVVHLNVARSLAGTGEERLLLPSMDVRF
jgi:ABC-type Fe3+-hydroxamate transport system substrate-binding protein